jgi:hypothetical protein
MRTPSERILPTRRYAVAKCFTLGEQFKFFAIAMRETYVWGTGGAERYVCLSRTADFDLEAGVIGF